LLGCLGGALIWRQASEAQRDRLRDLSRRSLMADFAERNGLLRVVAGVALVAVGAVLILARSDLSTLRDGLPAIAVTVAGLALVTGPWWLRLVSAFNAERAERIRTQERADLAAKVHDSVLQTLALIQRNADSPREVVRLARGQERELRSLLYGAASGTSAGTLAEALSQAAAEVEDLYAVRVDVVTVGDVPARTDGGPRRRDLDALVAAAREAMSNAARHSGADTVSVFLEVDDDAISVFVRDRGVGFDPDSVSADRQGLRGSILARMQRHGGTATITARPGQGAEVALTLPRGEPT
jgi:signal transduction histidine kinase